MISRFAKSFLAIVIALLVVTTVAFLHPPSRSYIEPWSGELFSVDAAPSTGQNPSPLHANVHGPVIMPKLGNATAKAALGRASWKLLHTVTLRYPENPTADERDALNSYFHLMSRLYPCGECATEFQELLRKFPPQTSSRRAASLWLCSVHNEVNKRLEKPEFDCAHLDSEYDCGCGDEPLNIPSTKGSGDPMDLEHDPSKDDLTGVGMIQGRRPS